MQLLKKAVLGLVSLHMLAWLVMLVAFAGIVFLAAGVYGLLATTLVPWAAALIVGAILLLLVTIIVLLVAIMALRKPKKPRKKDQTQAGHEPRLEEELEAALGKQTTQWARDNTGLAMLGAAAVGLLLATNRESRKVVCDAARPVATRKVMDIIQRLSRSE